MHSKSPALTKSISRSVLLIFALQFFAAAGLAGVLLASLAGIPNPFRDFYLVPWILLVFVIVLGPSIYLVYRQRFDAFHPLVYAAWQYFLPAFVLGSLFLATGTYEPFFMDLIPNCQYYVPLALLYVAVGFAGLSLGFAVPMAKRMGKALSRRLPAWDWQPGDLLLPCGLLLIVGELFRISAFWVGALGYQYSVSVFGTMLSSLTSLSSMASFLLWFAIFRTQRRTVRYHLVACLLIVLAIYSSIISGSRGGLVGGVTLAAMAYWLAGRRIKLRQGVILGALLLIALLAGMIYGTTFRRMKGTEAQVGLSEYLDIAGSTFATLSNQRLAENLAFAGDNLFRRFETISSLAVVVANYERLRPFEASYGIANNIWVYTWTAFIPRFIWPGKPIISDTRAYSALYFNYGDNSFAITPMGDLLRNFGPIGVPVGMALLGFVLRILYSALIEGQKPLAWRCVAYYLLLSNVSYEAFYGTILPGLVRVSFVLLLGGILVSVMVRRRDR